MVFNLNIYIYTSLKAKHPPSDYVYYKPSPLKVHNPE